MTTRIRRWIETDTGHRVPNHKSKCCHLHGHRYRWEAEIEGDVVDVEGVSDEGMLMDFSDVAAILKEHVESNCAPDLNGVAWEKESQHPWKAHEEVTKLVAV